MQNKKLTFVSLTKKYKKNIITTLFCILVSNLFGLVLPWSMKILIDDIIVNRDVELLSVFIFAVFVALSMRSIFDFCRKVLGKVIGEKVICDIRREVYVRMHKMPLIELQKITPANILSRMVSDSEAIKRFLAVDFIDVIYSSLSLVLISSVMFFINWRLTSVALLALPLFALFYFMLLPKVREGFKMMRDQNGKMISRVNEVLHGISVVRIFSAQEHEYMVFGKLQGKLFRIARSNHLLNVGLWVGIEAFTTIGFVMVLWLGGMDVVNGKMTTGELIAFYSYMGLLFSPVIRLVVINSFYHEAAAALNRINEIIDESYSDQDSSGVIACEDIEGHLEFKDVSFSYSPKEEVLKNISFVVEPGETIAIVGPNGAGKTTLISLLMRFVDQYQGEILVDGQPIDQYKINSYRGRIALVSQSDYLFSGTIKENILYGKFGASDTEVIEAATKARAHDFIVGFVDGYETEVGDRGLRLSAGQRQRVAIARALISKPSLLMLDEATSAIDAITENEIQKSIKEVMEEKTVIVVAHRFSTIMEADKIIVLGDGEILECGTHEKLVKRKGFYSELYNEQFKKKKGLFG